MNKTLNIFIYCVTMCILGLFFLLYKTESCKSGPPEQQLCKETFVPFNRNGCTNCDISCPPGTTMETVTFPTAGVHCKCPPSISSTKSIESSIPIPSASAAASQ